MVSYKDMIKNKNLNDFIIKKGGKTNEKNRKKRKVIP